MISQKNTKDKNNMMIHRPQEKAHIHLLFTLNILSCWKKASLMRSFRFLYVFFPHRFSALISPCCRYNVGFLLHVLHVRFFFHLKHFLWKYPRRRFKQVPCWDFQTWTYAGMQPKHATSNLTVVEIFICSGSWEANWDLEVGDIPVLWGVGGVLANITFRLSSSRDFCWKTIKPTVNNS